MKHADRDRISIRLGLAIALLAALVVTAAACQDFGQFPAPATPAEPPALQKTETTITIVTADKAILAVYQHLLSQAESHEAKAYLAEFYTVCDNWSAKSELFKDGSSVWYVLVDMTGIEKWTEPPHWQQAGWFVFRTGEVIPASRLQANALRIEADLQELSTPPRP